jgi:hypothetical protein
MKHIQVKVRFQARRWAGVILAALLLASLAIPMVGAAPARQAPDVIRIGYLGLAVS